MRKLFLILATIALVACSSMPSEKEAFIMSKEVVKTRLQQPDVKFPFADFSYDITKDSLYTVQSHFDSNNSRTNYRVKMYYKGGDWEKISSWSLKDIQTW